jgi:hypothetical protein
MHAIEESAKEKHGDDEDGSHEEGEVNAVEKGAIAVFATTRAEGLGDERVQADEDAFTEKGEDVKEVGADGNGADGYGTVREAANHHGVYDTHAHPTNLGEDEREGEAQGGAELGAEGREGEHETVERV